MCTHRLLDRIVLILIIILHRIMILPTRKHDTSYFSFKKQKRKRIIKELNEKKTI